MNSKDSNSMRSKFYRLLAAGGGLGYSPIAPGTFGSLIGVAMSVLFWQVTDGFNQTTRNLAAIVLMIILTIGAHHVIKAVENTSGLHDPKWIVIDEIVGQMLVLIWFFPTFWTLLSGFALFRLFDILKPGPIGDLDQKVHTPWGTLVDDLLAGAVAAAFLLALKFFVHLP
jgi:phosphatidylglycerophosphatase A